MVGAKGGDDDSRLAHAAGLSGGGLIFILILLTVATRYQVRRKTRDLICRTDELQKEIFERHRVEERALQNTKRYKNIFNSAAISMWEEDLSEVVREFGNLRDSGIVNLRRYLEENRAKAWDLAKKIVVKDVNDATLTMFSAGSREEMLRSIDKTFSQETLDVFIEGLCTIWEGKDFFRSEVPMLSLEGKNSRHLFRFRCPDPRKAGSV